MRAIRVLLPLAWMIASCASRSTPRLESEEDVLAALESAGASLAETAILPPLFLGTSGRVWQVDQSLVHIYEFETLEARQDAAARFSSDGATFDGSPLPWTAQPHVWSLGRVILLYDGTDGGTVLLLTGLFGDPMTSTASGPAGPYPPAVTAAIDALAASRGLEPEGIVVLDYESVEWPDACLGLQQMGEVCAQVFTPGWHVTLQAGGDRYLAHTDAFGEMVRFP